MDRVIKINHKAWLLAVACLALLASGCGPQNVTPSRADVWEFSQAEADSQPIEVGGIANWGENIVVVTFVETKAGKVTEKLDTVHISKDGGATFKKIDDFKAPAARDGATIVDIYVHDLNAALAYEHGFVFISRKKGIVVTDNDGAGLVAFRVTADASKYDGISKEDIGRFAVSGNMLVVGQEEQNAVIKLPKQKVTPGQVTTTGRLCDDAGQKINIGIGFINTNEIGDVAVFFHSNVDPIYLYKPGNLTANGDWRGEKSGVVHSMVNITSGNLLNNIGSQDVVSTKNGAAIWVYGNSNKPAKAFVHINASHQTTHSNAQGFKNFWVHRGKQEMYGVFKSSGLRKIDPTTGAFASVATDAALIRSGRSWFNKGQRTGTYEITEPLNAYFETPKGNIVMLTNTGALHVGVKVPRN